MPGRTLCGELTCWEPDELLLNHCSDDPNEPPDGDDFDFRKREENDMPRWFDTRKDLSDEENDSSQDSLDPDTSLVVMDDAAAEAQTVVDGEDLLDHFERMIVAVQGDVLLPAESRPRAPMSRGKRYNRAAVRV